MEVIYRDKKLAIKLTIKVNEVANLIQKKERRCFSWQNVKVKQGLYSKKVKGKFRTETCFFTGGLIKTPKEKSKPEVAPLLENTIKEEPKPEEKKEEPPKTEETK